MSYHDLVIVPHLEIRGANALSSPYTIGFPAVTAWLGASHHWQRQLRDNGQTKLVISGTGVVCHAFSLHTDSRTSKYADMIVGTGNPLTKEGKRPPFVPQASCSIDCTMALELEHFDPDDENAILTQLHSIALKGRVAGGDVLAMGRPRLWRVNGDDEDDLRRFLRELMPGYALVERRDLMISAMQAGENAIDALLDFLAIHHSPMTNGDTGHAEWRRHRREPGWIVPIATGFHGISDVAAPGRTTNQRDPSVPHRFAEAVVTLGEFVMPYRLTTLERLLWRYQFQEEQNLYVCVQTQGTMERGDNNGKD